MAQDKVVFVLWADRFDETLAALFVAEFRKAGLRVKLVSLVSHPSPGAYGVTLLPDLTLEQALPQAGHARCVVIPCGVSGLSRLKNDPRVLAFLTQAQQAGATFVVNEAGVDDLEGFEWAVSPPEVVVHADGQEMRALVRHITLRCFV